MLFDLHADGVRVTLDRMLASSIEAVQGHGALGLDAPHVDDCTRAFENRKRRSRAIDEAPEVRLEDLFGFVDRGFLGHSPHADTGIVHPRVDRSELIDCAIRGFEHRRTIGNVGREPNRLPTATSDLFGDVAKSFFVASDQYDLGASLGRELSRPESDAARSARDQDHLLSNGFQFCLHGASFSKRLATSLFYSAMTAFLGFKPMNDECTTMALAAFGRPLFEAELDRVIYASEDGFWRIDARYLDFDRFLEAPWTDTFVEIFGPARDPRRSLGWSSLEKIEPSESDRHWADFAASVQAVFEKLLLHSARSLREKSGESKLCLAGGAALNCVGNARLAKDSGFRELFVPVEPGDGGAAIGAAFAGHYLAAPGARASDRVSVGAPTHSYSVYMGQAHEFDPSWIECIDVPHSWEYRKMGAPLDARVWQVERGTPGGLVRRVAELIEAGQVVAVARERFELGPRALGNRSILFRPDSVELALRVSERIKDRAAYRPYALALLPLEAAEHLEFEEEGMPLQVDATMMRWMQLAVRVKASSHAKLRAGLHADGTTRPQVVVREENPFFHDVLVEVKKRTGLGAVVNTSLNEAGYPLVNTPEEAMLLFARTTLDAIVIGDVLVKKVVRS